MAVMRTYECPECEQCFDHLHLQRDEPPPSFCPLCGAAVGPVAALPSRVNIGKATTKATDNVYRRMEEGSQARAELAAEHLGVDKSEMSNMLITDLKDNTRAGETAAVATPNEVSRMMQQAPQGVVGLQGATAGLSYAANVAQGPFARAGNKAREGIVANHGRIAAQVARAGQIS